MNREPSQTIHNSENQAYLAYLELIRLYDKYLEANQILDDKFVHTFSNLSIILSIVGIAGIVTFEKPTSPMIGLLIILGSLFILFLLFFILGYFPRKYPLPVRSSIEFINSAIYSKPTYRDSIFQINKQYIVSINRLLATHKRKSTFLVILLSIYIGILILSIIILAISFFLGSIPVHL